MANDWNSVKPVGCKPWLVLPAVYSDALSYGDQIAHFCAALNKLIQNNNTLPEYIQQMIQDYINGDVIGEVVQNIVSQFILNVKYPPENLKPAVGDGSADDTEAIQGCINYAKNHNGMAVYIPSGAYSVQSLTLPGDVSLFGFDRYTTKLVLRGGATTPMISSVGTGFSIVGLTLDGNAGVQVENINVLSLISQDILLRDLIVQNGYKLLVYNGTGGHLQVNDIVFGNAVYDCVEISGGSIVQFDNCQFTALSQVSGQYVINISSNDGVYDFVNSAVCPVCCVVSGNDNYIQFSSIGAQKNFSDAGLRNNIFVRGQENKKYLSGDLTSTIEGSYGKNVNGSYSENISGAYTSVRNSTENKTVTNTSIKNYSDSQTENIANKKTINAKDINLNPTNPLQYKTPFNLNSAFNAIKFKDSNNSEYNILVEKDLSKLMYSGYPRSNDIDLKLKWRNLYKSTEYYGASPLLYSVSQGFTDLNDNKFMLSLIPSDNARNNVRSATLLTYNYNSLSAVKEIVVNADHANTLTYNPDTNEVYIANRHYVKNNVITGLTIISILNLDTDVLTTKDLGYTVTSISYDPLTQLIYVSSSDYHTIKVYNNEWSEIRSFTIKESGYKNLQSFAVYNNLIYALTLDPNMLLVCDNEGTTLMRYNFPNYLSDTVRIREPEDISITSDGVGHITFNYNLCDNIIMNCTAIADFDLMHNVDTSSSADVSVNSINPTNFYVDINSECVAPTGGINNKFKYPQEAIIAANSSKWMSAIINITTPGNYLSLQASNLHKAVQINGGSGVILDCGAVIYHTPEVTINDITISGKYNLEFDSNVLVYGGKLNLNNCVINNSEGYSITCSSFAVITLNNVTHDIVRLSNGSVLFDSNVDVIDYAYFSDLTCFSFPNLVEVWKGKEINNNNLSFNQNLARFSYIIIEFTFYGDTYKLIGSTSLGTQRFNVGNISTSNVMEMVEFNIVIKTSNGLEINNCKSINTSGNVTEITEATNVYVSRIIGVL